MSWRTALILPLVIALTLAAACSKSSTSPTPTPTTATAPAKPATGSIPAAATPAATSNLTSLSLIYVDSSKGQGSDVYVGGYDGSNAKKIATLAAGIRVMDARGNTLVAGNRTDFSVVDLKSGATKTVHSTNNIGSGLFLNDTTFIFTTAAGCGPPSSVATLSKLDLTSMAITEIAKPDAANLNIAGFDNNQVALTLRGCDVGVNNVAVYNLADGKLATTITVRGCGQAGVSFIAKKALVGQRACTQTGEHVGSDYTLVDFAAATQSSKDIRIGTGESNGDLFVIRPGQPQVIVSAQTPQGAAVPGPGTKPVSTGIFTFDLASGAFAHLVPADGPEQAPIAFSPDGRYLLVSAVRAQGNCDYSYVDMTTKALKPIAKDFTWCGTNGQLVGWTALK